MDLQESRHRRAHRRAVPGPVAQQAKEILEHAVLREDEIGGVPSAGAGGLDVGHRSSLAQRGGRAREAGGLPLHRTRGDEGGEVGGPYAGRSAEEAEGDRELRAAPAGDVLGGQPPEEVHEVRPGCGEDALGPCLLPVAARVHRDDQPAVP